jgi:hypothetical protein
MSAR